MLTFKNVKQWIREEARAVGAQLNGKEAQAMAGAYLTELDADPTLRYSVLTYADSTGEAAVKAWFKSVRP